MWKTRKKTSVILDKQSKNSIGKIQWSYHPKFISLVVAIADLIAKDARPVKIVVRQTKYAGAPIILMLGHTQSDPEVLKMIRDILFNGDIPKDQRYEVSQKDEEAAQIVGIKSTAGDIDIHKDCIDSEQRRKAEEIAKKVDENLQTLAGYREDIPDIPAFANAVSSLFEVPVANQSNLELVGTFLSLTNFSLTVIQFYNNCRKNNLSKFDIAVIFITIGMQMYQVAIRYGLYTWIQKNGGLWGLSTKIRNYFSQLISNATSAVSLPWPETVTLFGIVIFATSAAVLFYKCK